jgi:hypothetical protein
MIEGTIANEIMERGTVHRVTRRVIGGNVTTHRSAHCTQCEEECNGQRHDRMPVPEL